MNADPMTDSARPLTCSKVMIVDDDPVIVKIIERMLARRGVEVVTSLRSLGILNLLATHRPALVILDVNMPALGGPALAKLVRGDPELRGTKIILLSALEKDLLAAKAKECGADGYITKAAGIAGLAQYLERWLPDTADAP
jgi:two-component system alkaline phosphatase synthesis response regulator PhoP